MKQHVRAVLIGVCLTVTAFAHAPPPPHAVVPAPPETVVIDVGERATALYHRDTCPWLSSAVRKRFALADAQKRYYQPHCACVTGTDVAPANCAAAVEAKVLPADASHAMEATDAVSSTSSAGGTTSAGTASSDKTVHVRGYTRKDGTYVKPHTRRAPRRK